MFLATTALEEFWNKEEKILFLGEWCKLYDKKDEIEKLDYETLDFEWSKLEKQRNAIIYCNQIYEDILDELVVILNNYHNIDQDKKYWRILLSSWLLPFIQIAYDKYVHITKSLEHNNLIYTYVMYEKDYFVPQNFYEMMMYFKDDKYNLQLYSQIYKKLSNSYEEKSIYKEQMKGNHIERRSFKKFIFYKLLSLLSLLNIFNKHSVLASSLYMKSNKLLSLIWLSIKSKFLFQFDDLDWDIRYSKTICVDNRKKMFTHAIKKDKFTEIVFDLFTYNFPSIFIEGFLHINKIIDTQYKYNANIIFTANAIHYNDIFKFVVANKNLQIIYMQHGGGYGMEELLTSEKIERDISDLYLTNGWQDSNQTKPLAMATLSNKKNISKNSAILLIMTAMPRYVYRFNFAEDSTKMLNYIENTKKFLQNFNLKEKLIIRPYMQDYQWNIKARLLKINGDLKFDNHTNYYKQIKNARIVIFDHMHTGYLETLSVNIPTVIIIPQNIYYFRESAKPYIQLLKDANILFENPLEAAEFVEIVYSNVASWWQSDNVQNAREEFCYRYARTSENWADEWIKEFNTILEENARNNS